MFLTVTKFNQVSVRCQLHLEDSSIVPVRLLFQYEISFRLDVVVDSFQFHKYFMEQKKLILQISNHEFLIMIREFHRGSLQSLDFSTLGFQLKWYAKCKKIQILVDDTA